VIIKPENFSFELVRQQSKRNIRYLRNYQGFIDIFLFWRGKLELTLEKNNKIHQEILNPFDVFTFWGDQEVKSKGKVRDFNLMLQQCKGKLEAIKMEERQVLHSASGCFFLYLEQGNVVVEKLDSEERPLELKAKESFYEFITRVKKLCHYPNS
jgi:hypothetical protein